VSADNPSLAMEKVASSWITTCLQTYGEFRDTMTEAVFLSTYGAPWLQAMVGLGTPEGTPRQHERDLVREASTTRARSDLEHRFEVGSLEEAMMRPLLTSECRKGALMSVASL
jgi:hypothetical protein